ncbi:Hypothetical predicted protein [Podarcis lilfordi]|uniref:Uncharacterized protein n=1 Tax=Podarcis lilfordi TaxID=74358 RepID=A0AA35JR79_9SAUR|nr:Hypothetical predicted protein [Podarcis lilfordi]
MPLTWAAFLRPQLGCCGAPDFSCKAAPQKDGKIRTASLLLFLGVLTVLFYQCMFKKNHMLPQLIISNMK